MSLFFLILGIVLLIGGFVCYFISEDSYDWEELLAIGGIMSMVAGIFMIVFGTIGVCGGFDKPSSATQTITLVNDIPVAIPKDSIYAIQYVISWKDEDGAQCGQNVKLLGRTDKNIGDTIIVNIQ